MSHSVNDDLVGFKHVLFSIAYGNIYIYIFPIDELIFFQRGNHQPGVYLGEVPEPHQYLGDCLPANSQP